MYPLIGPRPPVIELYPPELQPMVDAYKTNTPMSDEDYIKALQYVMGDFAVLTRLAKEYPREIIYGGRTVVDRDRLGAMVLERLHRQG